MNRVVVAQKKLDGKSLRWQTHKMLENRVETLCGNFSGWRLDVGWWWCTANIILNRTDDGGVPPHAFTDEAEKAAYQLHKYYFIRHERQKEAGNHLTPDAENDILMVFCLLMQIFPVLLVVLCIYPKSLFATLPKIFSSEAKNPLVVAMYLICCLKCIEHSNKNGEG